MPRRALLARTGVSNIPAVEAKRAYGIYHHFYNHPWNIVGMEYLAKDIYPQAFTASIPMRRTTTSCVISPPCRTCRSFFLATR
jgi:hypothetical protein